MSVGVTELRISAAVQPFPRRSATSNWKYARISWGLFGVFNVLVHGVDIRHLECGHAPDNWWVLPSFIL
ncbi:hypothetical protein SCLCIDRAFT_1225510 [Scleroderma citrinum Foug A]|uniref:Uncharacterized protein n=1 Tax=Scleroderma citrinum Foug A TaxID=1036808 RepID=A0A0C3D0L5_9AGAM|nr:hypothetical protein SCLCIDRAFT_1225510 [Scleroderma citrinum Foug A]